MIIGTHLEDLADNIHSVIPVKPFEGTEKKDHSFKYLTQYLINNIANSSCGNCQSVISKDFIKMASPTKHNKKFTM